jgi:acid-sensing ion channel, other
MFPLDFSILCFFHRISKDFLTTQKFKLKFPNANQSEYLKENQVLEATRLQNGLKLILSTNENLGEFDVCTSPSFLVHSPYELPGSYDSSDRYEISNDIDFGFGFDLQVLITPEIISTDESLRSLDPETRGCYFEGEKKLEFFKVYTRRNCEFECFGKTMQGYPSLNCTQYFVARSDEMELCDYRKEVYSQAATYDALRRKDKCGCLDECNSIKYTTEVIALKIENKLEASFEFKFKDVDIVPLKRYQLFTFSEFLAQAGGMMGLFAGISVLSIVEIFYFLSLRWMMDFWKALKQR